MRPASNFVVELTPRVLTAVTIHGQAYTAGQTPTLRYAIDDYVTGGADTPALEPHEVAVLKILNFEQSAFSIGNGWLELGGFAARSGGLIQLNNADGDMDDFSSLSFDGAAVAVKEGLYVWDQARGWIAEPFVDFKVWMQGLSKGRPRISDTVVSIEIADLAVKLNVDLQASKFLGLGGALLFESAGSVGVAEDPDNLLDPALAALTLIFLSRIDTAQGYSVAKGTEAAGPFWVKAIATGGGTMHCGVRTAGGVSEVDSAAQGLAKWFWTVLRYDGALVEVFTADVDGSNWTAGGTAARTGSTVSVSEALELGRAGVGSTEFRGALAHVRLYSVALPTATAQAQIGRLLDMDVAADTDNLLLSIPADDRFGLWASDLADDHLDAQLTTVSWATTGTGRPDLKGKPMPLTLGPAAHVTLTLVDELATGRVYTCNWRSVSKWRYVFAGAVGLAGPFALTSSAIRFDAGRKLLLGTAGAGLLDGLVPDQQFSVTGSASNNVTFTVDGFNLGPDHCRVLETVVTEAAGASVTITGLNPGWTLLQAGDASNPTLILVTGGATGELTATVDGDDAGPVGYADTFEKQIKVLCVDMSPGFLVSNLDFSGLGASSALVTSWYRGIDPIAALEAVHSLCVSIMAHAAAVSDTQLDFDLVDLSSAAAVIGTFVRDGSGDAGDGIIMSLAVVDLGAPPSELRVGYAPAYSTLTEGEIAEAAWPREADFVRAEYRWAVQAVAAVADWPLSRGAATGEPPEIPTHLVNRAAAEAQAVARATAAQSKVVTVKLSELPAGLAIGSKLSLAYDRHGFDEGVTVWVVGFALNGTTGLVEVDAAIPPL